MNNQSGYQYCSCIEAICLFVFWTFAPTQKARSSVIVKVFGSLQNKGYFQRFSESTQRAWSERHTRVLCACLRFSPVVPFSVLQKDVSEDGILKVLGSTLLQCSLVHRTILLLSLSVHEILEHVPVQINQYSKYLNRQVSDRIIKLTNK